jgi:RNA polymerase sigma-70 factor, ECF subfamily
MRRWRQGDVAAFEALVRRWQQPVGRFLARLVDKSESVPDLCQEVFLRFYLAGPKYREQGSFSTWLYRIALNVARDFARRRPPTMAIRHDPADAATTAEQACELHELAEEVARALAELPTPLREVIVLRHYEGMTFEEMGRLLSQPASTLKSRFAAALARLRVRLRHLGWAHEEMKE